MFTRSTPPTRPCAVYAALNKRGTPIYVGITCDPIRRWREHKCDKPWESEIADWWLIEWHDTEAEARAHETALIRELRTRWNIDESPVAAEVRARYLREFGYVPEAKPHRPYVKTLAWPLRLILLLARVVWFVAYGLLRLFWAVFSFLFCWVFDIRRRKRRRRRR